MAETPKREVAKICTVLDLISGEYIIEEGWSPNYVLSKGRRLSRVNLMGIVVSKPSPNQFSLDDGTATISITDFNKLKSVANLQIGEAVLVIGRPRKNEDTIFISCELVNAKQLKENPSWLSYRKEELKAVPKEIIEEKVSSVVSTSAFANESKKTTEVVKEKIVEEKAQQVIGDVVGEDIIVFIKKKDTGEGCLIEDIISYFGDGIDDHVLTLITMGEIYEIKPGRVKVLE